MSRPLLLTLVLLPLVVLSATLHEHHHKHGGHKREYVMCQSYDGDLYFYKNKGKSDTGYTTCDIDIAKAQLVNSINQTGWGLLDVEIASDKIPDWLQGYAAGFLEGRTTRDLISLQVYNTAEEYCIGAEDYCDRLTEFLLENMQWMRAEIENKPHDIYWKHVNVTLNQFAGMIDGYHGRINQRLSDDDLVIHPLYLIQLAGDIEDLEIRFNKPKNLRRTWIGSGHCSALVKVNHKSTNLLFSHVTWSSYSSMLRLQKRYRFKLHNAPGRTYTFSSYPGSIPSVDDFILTSAKLAIFETTISNYNKELIKEIIPKKNLCWIRSQVATRLADSGEEWAQTFGRNNSGTYNNQWVIVDYKKFRPGEHKLENGLLTVLEQLPLYTVTHAPTVAEHFNKKRYWPSYNMPFYDDIYEKSGTGELAKKYGDWFTKDKTPRALIFARDHHTVQDIDSMRRLMRSNNYTLDPLSKCDCNPPYSAENAIACRSDLNPADGTYPFEALGFRDHGATDITDIHLMETLSFDAVAGPTYDPTPIFSWKTTPFKDSVRHAGQPDEFRFGPLRHIWDQKSLYA